MASGLIKRQRSHLIAMRQYLFQDYILRAMNISLPDCIVSVLQFIIKTKLDFSFAKKTKKNTYKMIGCHVIKFYFNMSCSQPDLS